MINFSSIMLVCYEVKRIGNLVFVRMFSLDECYF